MWISRMNYDRLLDERDAAEEARDRYALRNAVSDALAEEWKRRALDAERMIEMLLSNTDALGLNMTVEEMEEGDPLAIPEWVNAPLPDDTPATPAFAALPEGMEKYAVPLSEIAEEFDEDGNRLTLTSAALADFEREQPCDHIDWGDEQANPDAPLIRVCYDCGATSNDTKENHDG